MPCAEAHGIFASSDIKKFILRYFNIRQAISAEKRIDRYILK